MPIGSGQLASPMGEDFERYGLTWLTISCRSFVGVRSPATTVVNSFMTLLRHGGIDELERCLVMLISQTQLERSLRRIHPTSASAEAPSLYLRIRRMVSCQFRSEGIRNSGVGKGLTEVSEMCSRLTNIRLQM